MFRVKIILLSVLLSGLVLVGFGLYSLSVVNKVGMARIDREILTLGEGHLAIKPPRDYWQNFDASLRFIYGEERSGNLIVRIRDMRSEILFQSAHWPAMITEDSFPDFDRKMDNRPTAPGDRARGERIGDLPFGPPVGTPERPSARESRIARGDRRGPPPEAYQACEGKRSGSVAQYTNPRGETVKGTCEDEGGKQVLRPDVRESDRQGWVHGKPGDRPLSPSRHDNPPEWPLPRMKKTPSFATLRTQSGVWRTGIMGSDRLTLMIGINLAGFYEDANRYRRAFLIAVPIALILLAGGGWLIARRALKPVAMITRTAAGITVHALDQRVPQVDGDGEFSRLVDVINGMLERLEKSFGQAVRFSADAAHELQTPLAILQGELDDAVQHAPVGSGEQQRYSGLLEEVQRLKAIVQKLLILARADAGRLELRLEAVDLSAMIASAAEDAGAMAPQLQLDKQIVPGVVVQADPDLIEQAVRNLTSNAVKYNGENGLIRFQLSVHDHIARVTVANTGVPIPASDREKIFDRFYRVDPARSGKVPGSGLGLSLAREIVRAHHGNLCLDPDSGDRVSFTLSLPCTTG